MSGLGGGGGRRGLHAHLRRLQHRLLNLASHEGVVRQEKPHLRQRFPERANRSLPKVVAPHHHLPQAGQLRRAKRRRNAGNGCHHTRVQITRGLNR
jgi:hypothetical protein